MNHKEIKKIERQFELDMYPTMPDMLSAKAMLEWLLKDYCIIPKRRVLEYYRGHLKQLSIPSRDPRDAYEMDDSRSRILALENIFGKSLFEEEK